eukprot:COSAG01_NODE_31451_length_597_cov_1.417671_1_plen_153_part_01
MRRRWWCCCCHAGRMPPPELSKLPPFFEAGSMHKCAAVSCARALQAPERCELLQCHHPGCETFLSAAAEARRRQAEETARQERERRRLELVAKSLKCGQAFGSKRDGGESDLKAIRWFQMGLHGTKGDPNHAGLQAGLHSIFLLLSGRSNFTT